MNKIVIPFIVFLVTFLVMLLFCLRTSFFAGMFFPEDNFIELYFYFAIGILILLNIKKIPRKIVYTIIIAGILPMLFLDEVKSFQENRTKRQALKLIEQIDAYKIEKGKYPSNLHELVPDYLNTIPKYWISVLPKNFEYELIPEHDEFGLYFYTFQQGTISYSGATKEWFYND